MVINKNIYAPVTAMIDLEEFVPISNGEAWVSNVPSIDATNEKKHDNFNVIQHEYEIKKFPVEFIFEPNSLTAIEFEKAIL